jgi:hypothetical protein
MVQATETAGRPQDIRRAAAAGSLPAGRDRNSISFVVFFTASRVFVLGENRQNIFRRFFHFKPSCPE